MFKNKLLITTLILVLIAIFGLVVVNLFVINKETPKDELAANASGEAMEEYYYYEGRKIALERVPGLLAVELKETSTISDLGDLDSFVQMPDNWAIIGSVDGIDKNPHVVNTAPVYSQDHTIVFIPNEFFVQFNDDISEAEIEIMGERDNLEIVEKQPLLGNNYLLRTTPETKLPILEIINNYHLNAKTKYATPNFMRLSSGFSTHKL